MNKQEIREALNRVHDIPPTFRGDSVYWYSDRERKNGVLFSPTTVKQNGHLLYEPKIYVTPLGHVVLAMTDIYPSGSPVFQLRDLQLGRVAIPHMRAYCFLIHKGIHPEIGCKLILPEEAACTLDLRLGYKAYEQIVGERLLEKERADLLGKVRQVKFELEPDDYSLSFRHGYNEIVHSALESKFRYCEDKVWEHIWGDHQRDLAFVDAWMSQRIPVRRGREEEIPDIWKIASPFTLMDESFREKVSDLLILMGHIASESGNHFGPHVKAYTTTTNNNK